MSVLVLMEDGTAGDDGLVSLSSVARGPCGPGSCMGTTGQEWCVNPLLRCTVGQSTNTFFSLFKC